MQDNLVFSSVIRKRKTVLCEFTNNCGKFHKLIKSALQKLNSVEDKDEFRCTFRFDQYHFFCLFSDSIYIITIIVSDKEMKSEEEHILYGFNYKLYSTLNQTYSNEQLMQKKPYSLVEFLPKLRENVQLFNSKSYKSFSDQIQRALMIVHEESLNRKTFEFDFPINYPLVMKVSEAHEDSPKDLDPLEIRASTYKKYKVESKNLSRNDTSESFLPIQPSDSMMEVSQSDIASVDLNTHEIDKEIKKNKKFSPLKILIFSLLVLLILGAAIALIVIFLSHSE